MKRARFPSIDEVTSQQSSKYESPQKKSRNVYLLEDDTDTKRLFSYSKYYSNDCDLESKSSEAFRFSVSPHPDQSQNQKPHCNKLILLLANVLMVVSSHYEGGQISERNALFQARTDQRACFRSSSAKLNEKDLLEYIQRSVKFVTGSKQPIDMWKLELACSAFEWFASTQSTKYFNELVESLKPSLEVCIHHNPQSLLNLYSKLSSSDVGEATLTPRKRRFTMFGRLREDEKKQSSKRFVLNLDEEGRYCSLWAILTDGDGTIQVFELCCGLVNLQRDFTDRNLIEYELGLKKRLKGEVLSWRKVINMDGDYLAEYQTNQQAKRVSFYDWNFREFPLEQASTIADEETDAILIPVLSDLKQEAINLLESKSDKEESATEAIDGIIQKLGHLDHLIKQKSLSLSSTHQATINMVQEAGCTVLVRVLTSMTEITPMTRRHLESIRALVNSSARLQTIQVTSVLTQVEETLEKNST